MKILIDARMYGLENTGIGRYLVNLIRYLQELETPHSYTVLLREKYFDKIKLKTGWRKILAEIPHYTLEEQIKLPELLRQENADLVHFPHFNVPLIWNGNFVVTLHDMNMHKQGIDATKLPLPVYLLKRIPYKMVFRKAVYRSSKIITPSNIVKGEIAGYFRIKEDKISTIYEGVDEIYFKKTKKDIPKTYGLNNEYFLYVGNLYPHKNIEAAIDAIVKLNEKIDKHVILAISCSRNSFSERLETIIRSKDASDFVKLVGFVPDDDLVALQKNSLGLIYPSFSEGFGLQGLEAMAAGTVVIASNIPIFKEIYKDFAIYFDPHEISSIEGSLEYVINMSPDDRKLLLTKSQVFVSRYSWKNMAAATLQIYDNILQKI